LRNFHAEHQQPYVEWFLDDDSGFNQPMRHGRPKKGGAGKTTSSLLVAEALRQSGNHVALQDFDKQGSSTKSIRHSGSEVEIAVPKNQYTYIVFDTPPNLEHAASLIASNKRM